MMTSGRWQHMHCADAAPVHEVLDIGRDTSSVVQLLVMSLGLEKILL